MAKKRYLTAREAAEALGISMATLYAYVSRGLVRSEAAGVDPRRRRYYAEDVDISSPAKRCAAIPTGSLRTPFTRRCTGACPCWNRP